MLNSIFGELVFDIGWKGKATISFFGTECPITIKVKAYFEEEGITIEQEKAYLDYTKNKEMKIVTIEYLLSQYSKNASERFVPKTLLFERDGSYALLCDDNDEPDEGIAVCITPIECIMLQDDYL